MFDFQMVRIGLSSVKSATSNVFSFSPPSPLVSNPVFADYCWSSTIPLFLLVHSHFRWSHLRLMFQRWSSKIYMLQSDIILVEVSICLDNREHFCLKKKKSWNQAVSETHADETGSCGFAALHLRDGDSQTVPELTSRYQPSPIRDSLLVLRYMLRFTVL